MAAPWVYVDTSALQRSLDRLVSSREHEESEAVAALLDAAAVGAVRTVWSYALDEEFSKIPVHMSTRIALGYGLRALATAHVDRAPSLLVRAAYLQTAVPLGEWDAHHLACAEAADASLVTVDQRFRDRVVRFGKASIKAMDPIEARRHFGI